MKKDETVAVKVGLYGLEAVYLASYALLDRAYIRLEGDPKGTVKVRIKPKKDLSAKTLSALAGEFSNELIHQALRTKVSAANRQIREHIILRALTSAQGPAPGAGESSEHAEPAAGEKPLLDEELEKEVDKLLAEVEKEGGEDPLNIAAPWEETHAEKTASNKKKDGAKPAQKAAGPPNRPSVDENLEEEANKLLAEIEKGEKENALDIAAPRKRKGGAKHAKKTAALKKNAS